MRQAPARAYQAQVDAGPVPIGRGGLSADHFQGEAVRYRVDGIREVPSPVPSDVVRVLDDGPIDRCGAHRLSVPDLWEDEAPRLPSLWCLEDAHVFGGSIRELAWGRHQSGQLLLTSSGGILPCSRGVLDGHWTLSADLLCAEGSGWIVNAPPSSRCLDGTYVLLGSVHTHFGHSILEGLTRAWVLPYLSAELRASVRFLTYEPRIDAYAREFLVRAGVPSEHIVHASAWDVVERLIVPGVAMRSHRWITSAQSEVWSRVALNSGTPERRVFLSRSGVKNRPVSNEQQLEQAFRCAGWEVVRPDRLAIEEQLKLAAGARSLAGCVGSQMYLACFQPPGGSNIVLAPRNFFLRDDTLIASALGHDLRIVFGGTIDFRLPKAERVWSIDAEPVEELLRSHQVQGPLVAGDQVLSAQADDR
ncbi:glycosyltransferase family 61 protein [Actinopolymorpha sp. B9G3]|uniref:glycosyltransferase family 61 protein n=1 Tax=Actinopolymorpha sp. B9G3 TaxID=3158970 RepID=UPI0032D8BA54